MYKFTLILVSYRSFLLFWVKIWRLWCPSTLWVARLLHWWIQFLIVFWFSLIIITNLHQARALTVCVEYVTVFCTHSAALSNSNVWYDVDDMWSRSIESLILVKRVYFCMSDFFCLINIRVLFYLYISMRAIKSFYSEIITIRNLVDCVI